MVELLKSDAYKYKFEGAQSLHEDIVHFCFSKNE